MLEAIRIRKAGFAIRIDNEEFCRRYKPCLKGAAVQFKDKLANEVAKGILTTVFDKANKMEGKWQLGFTKVFLKEEARSFLEMQLGESLKQQVVLIQALARGYFARKLARRFRSSYRKIVKFVQRRFLIAKLRSLIEQSISGIKKVLTMIQRWNRRRRINKLIKRAVKEVEKRALDKKMAQQAAE